MNLNKKNGNGGKQLIKKETNLLKFVLKHHSEIIFTFNSLKEKKKAL